MGLFVTQYWTKLLLRSLTTTEHLMNVNKLLQRLQRYFLLIMKYECSNIKYIP